VRVDEIVSIKHDLAKRVMTGGREPNVSIRLGPENQILDQTPESTKSIKISDSAAM